MPSWHQERNGHPLPKLSHPTKWTSYNPQGHLSVMRHESREACMAYCNKTGDIPLPPQPREDIMISTCRTCGDDINPKRVALGYKVCILCGEEHARQERQSWTIAPLHKSNYMLLTSKEDLKGINNKGGLHR